MNVDPSAVASALGEWGSDDPALDALMVLGPVVVAVFVLAGRNVVTTTLAATYLAGFLSVVAVNAVRNGERT